MPPKKVSQATANLRTVSDTVGLFLATECSFEAGFSLSRSAFREIFEKWCAEDGIRKAPSGKRVADALRERNVKDGGKIHGERFWSGIRWKNADERTALERTGDFRMSYRMYRNVQYGLGAHGALRPLFPGKSYEKCVQEKDPGNDPQCAPCAPKKSGCSCWCCCVNRCGRSYEFVS